MLFKIILFLCFQSFSYANMLLASVLDSHFVKLLPFLPFSDVFFFFADTPIQQVHMHQ